MNPINSMIASALALSFKSLTPKDRFYFVNLFGTCTAIAEKRLVCSIASFFIRWDFRKKDVVSANRKAGFKEVARNSETRPVFLYSMGD